MHTLPIITAKEFSPYIHSDNDIRPRHKDGPRADPGRHRMVYNDSRDYPPTWYKRQWNINSEETDNGL
jgi:hypothetical protein